VKIKQFWMQGDGLVGVLSVSDKSEGGNKRQAAPSPLVCAV
jgi:hypothetical protein